MLYKIQSITIGQFTYLVGSQCPKPLGYEDTEDVIVRDLFVKGGMAVVEFADGDRLAVGLAAARLLYKPMRDTNK